jgi:hypothetical protein
MSKNGPGERGANPICKERTPSFEYLPWYHTPWHKFHGNPERM